MSAAPTATLLRVSATDPEPFFSNRECECGCGNLLTTAWARRNRKFIIGHKPTETAPTISGMRKHVKSNMGPEQIAAYFKAQVDQLSANRKKLMDDAAELLAQGKKKMAQAQELAQQIEQINAVAAQTQDALSRIFKAKQ